MTIQDKPDYIRVKREVKKILDDFGVIEPPVDPVMIARSLGVHIIFAGFTPEMDTVSGFYDADENAIYVNRNEYPLRQTFTVAHELGHKIMHEEWAKSSEYKVLLRDDIFGNSDPKEKEANAFAAHLLVPRFLLDRYWQDASLEQLSLIFAVSVPVIKNRIAFEYGA